MIIHEVKNQEAEPLSECMNHQRKTYKKPVLISFATLDIQTGNERVIENDNGQIS